MLILIYHYGLSLSLDKLMSGIIYYVDILVQNSTYFINRRKTTALVIIVNKKNAGKSRIKQNFTSCYCKMQKK